MSYRVLPKTGPDHTISYPVGVALERLLAAPAGSEDRVRIRADEEAAGRIRHARAGDVVTDLPAMSVDALLAGGDVELVVDQAPAPLLEDEKDGEA